jgi:hypothetical protein
MAWQQTLVDPPEPAVALADRVLETRPIRDRNAAAALLDQPRGLQHAGHHAHRGALYPQHLGQELMREGQRVPVRSVVQAEDPAAAAGFHRMNRIAGDRLERVGQQGLA